MEDDAEGIDVGSAVDLCVVPGCLILQLSHRGDMLRRHVRQSSAQVGGALTVRAVESCQVEVEQHRIGVGGDEHVGGLDVVVQNSAIVGVLKCFGETGSPPRDRPRERASAQRLTPFRPRSGPCRRAQLVEGREQFGPCLC